MFFPQEIIFAATDSCNLHCKHCFVSRHPLKLDADRAIRFISSCVEYSNNIPAPEQKGLIEKIGFTGGEPFLYLDFMENIVRHCVSQDLMFDQIMTNGDWWKDETELSEKLQVLYNAGYDGKIGLSWDSFHGQSAERIETFISKVQEVFGPDSLTIQIVQGGECDVLFSDNTKSEIKLVSEAHLPLAPAVPSSATPSNGAHPRNAPVTIPQYLDLNHPEIPYYLLPQTFQSEDSRAWQSKKWFKEDYCEGPGQILFIHPNGNIAPCCGFANENPELFIGTINDSFEEVLKKASTNQMVKICYETGLKKYIKVLKKSRIKTPGKTADICSFCDFVCKLR